MNDAAKQSIMGLVRNILAAVGGLLTAKGYIDDATVQIYLGAAMVIIPAIWTIWDKYRSEAQSQVREQTAVNVGITVSNATPSATPLVTPTEAQDAIAQIAPTMFTPTDEVKL